MALTFRYKSNFILILNITFLKKYIYKYRKYLIKIFARFVITNNIITM